MCSRDSLPAEGRSRARGPSWGRVALFALLAATLASPLAVLAQDEPKKPDEGLGGGREITEEMKKMCPDLKTAVGRQKDQLLALYFELDWRKAGEEATKKQVAALFDLDKAEDASLLEKHGSLDGPQRCLGGIRCVIAASGPKGLLFCIERFDKATPKQKRPWIEGVAAVSYREAWRYLEKLLDDKSEVPSWRASQEAPPGYKHLRTCDYACRTLGPMVEAVPGVELPKELQGGQIGSLMKLEERDGRIAGLKKFMAESKALKEHLAKTASVLEGLDEPKKKSAQELLGKLGISSDK